MPTILAMMLLAVAPWVIGGVLIIAAKMQSPDTAPGRSHGTLLVGVGLTLSWTLTFLLANIIATVGLVDRSVGVWWPVAYALLGVLLLLRPLFALSPLTRWMSPERVSALGQPSVARAMRALGIYSLLASGVPLALMLWV